MMKILNELKRMHAEAEGEMDRYIGEDLFKYGRACGKEDALARCISMIESGAWDDDPSSAGAVEPASDDAGISPLNDAKARIIKVINQGVRA